MSLAGTSIDEDSDLIQRGVMPNEYVRLTVSDTGSGIPEEIIERIFDPFFTTKKAGEGTGLGLSVVHGIVKKHAGMIIVDSLPGEGTTFSVFFPLFRKDDVAVHEQGVEPLHGGSERILIVDDEALLADILPRMLGELGYLTVTRTSGTEAFETFKAHPEAFDLVLTDQTMPDMTGVELARRITRIRPDMPVILCTGFSDPQLPAETQRTGISAVLHKPIVWAELDKAVRRALASEALLKKDSKGITNG